MRKRIFSKKFLLFVLILGLLIAAVDRWIIPKVIRYAINQAIGDLEDCEVHVGPISANFFAQTARASDVRLFCNATQVDEIKIKEIEIGIGNLWPRLARIDIRSIDLTGAKLLWGDKYQGLTHLIDHFTKDDPGKEPSSINVSVRNVRLRGEDGEPAIQLSYDGIDYHFAKPNLDLLRTGIDRYTLRATAVKASVSRSGGASVDLGEFDLAAKISADSFEIVRANIGDGSEAGSLVVSPAGQNNLADVRLRLSESLIRLIGDLDAEDKTAVRGVSFSGFASPNILVPDLDGRIEISIKEPLSALTGQISIKGLAPEFSADLQMDSITASELRIGPTKFKLNGVAKQLSIELNSAFNDQPIFGSLKSDRDGKLDGTISIPQTPIAKFGPEFKPLLIFGDDLSAHLSITGVLTKPIFEGQVTQTSGNQLQVKFDEEAGLQVAGRLMENALSIDLRCFGVKGDELRVQATELQAEQIRSKLEKIDIKIPELSGAISGSYGVTGPLNNLPFGNGTLKISSLNISRGPERIVLEEEMLVDVTPAAAKIKKASFASNRSKFDLSGSISANGDLDLKTGGKMTLSSLIGKFSDIEELDGDLTLSLALSGTIDSPQLNGKLVLADGRLIFPLGGTIVGFTRTKADVDIVGDKLSVSDLTADFAGARVVGRGQLENLFDEAKLQGGLELKFADVISEPSPGLTLTMNGKLGLKKIPSEEFTVYGDLALGRSGYVNTISLASLLRGLQDLLLPRQLSQNVIVEASSATGPKLDLTLTTTSPFVVDTSVVKGELAGDLKIGGYFSNPLINGSIKGSKGEFSLGRKKFALYTAEADFDGRSGINPTIRFVADTEVRGRDGEPSQAQLMISGRLASPQVKILSNSGLSENEIMAQLTASSGVNLFGGETDRSTESKLFGIVGVSTPLDVGQKLSEIIGLKEVQVGNALTVTGEVVPEVTAIRPLKDPFSLHFRSQFSKDQESAANLLYAITPDTSFLAGVRSNTPSRQATQGSESAEFGVQRKRSFSGYGLFDWLDPTTPSVKIDADASPQTPSSGWKMERFVLNTNDTPPELANELREKLDRYVGDLYSEAKVREIKLELLRIVRKKGYLQASIDKDLVDDSTSGTVSLSLLLRSKFAISFEGNHLLSHDDLIDLLKLDNRLVPVSSGSMLTLQTEIRSLYQRYGHYRVEIKVDETTSAEDGARNFIFHIDEGPQVSVVEVSLVGNDNISTAELIDSLSIQVRGGILLRPWFPGRVTDVMLEHDMQSIQQIYGDNGYFETKVQFEIIPVDDSNAEIKVAYQIDEGEQSMIRSIEIDYEGDSEIKARVLSILDRVSVGDYFNRRSIEEAKTKADSIISGTFAFYNSDVNYEYRPSDSKLVWHIRTGNTIKVKSVEITGEKQVDPDLLRRELTFKAGEQLTDHKIEQSIQNLFESGLVSSAKIEPKDGDWKESSEDMLVEVKEREGGTVAGSVTVNSEDGLHLSGDMNQRNLFATGNTIRFRADTYMKDFNSIIDAGNIGVSLGIPHFDGERGKLTLDAFADYSILLIEPYSFDRVGGRINYDIPVRSKSKVRLSLNEYTERLFDVPDDIIISDKDTGQNFFGGLGSELDIDERNDRFSPSSGNRFVASMNIFTQALGSSVDFAQLSLRDGLYVPNTTKTFWYFGVTAKAAQPFFGTDSIPLSHRYFLGGRDSLRGFSRNVVGPRGTEGDIAGGDTAVNASAEYHYRFTDGFETLLFLDAGQSYLRNEGDFEGENQHLNDPRYSPGIGFRFITPVGPLGVEYGVNPDQQNGERPGRLYFGLGGTF